MDLEALLVSTPASNDVAGIITAAIGAVLIVAWAAAIGAWLSILRR